MARAYRQYANSAPLPPRREGKNLKTLPRAHSDFIQEQPPARKYKISVLFSLDSWIKVSVLEEVKGSWKNMSVLIINKLSWKKISVLRGDVPTKEYARCRIRTRLQALVSPPRPFSHLSSPVVLLDRSLFALLYCS